MFSRRVPFSIGRRAEVPRAAARTLSRPSPFGRARGEKGQEGAEEAFGALSDNPRCCDAHSRRSQRQSEVQSAVQQPPAGPREDERRELPRRAAGRGGGGAKTAPPRKPQHGRDHRRPPGRAGPDRQPQLSVLGPALPLAVQQDAARRLQGESRPASREADVLKVR